MGVKSFACLILAVTACDSSRTYFECQDDASCNISGGGRCVSAATGGQWCAYPDPACESGYRYSDDDVGDDLAGVCTEAPPPAVTFQLSVTVGGTGAGVVESLPSGFSCTTGTCSASFPPGTELQLAAMSTTHAFLGWSDDCKGGGGCAIVMDRDRAVGALFGTPGQALWVKQFGGTGDELGRNIAIDPNGDLIVVGEFKGAFSMGSTTLTSKVATTDDIFVAKLAADTGDVIWAKSFGGAKNDYQPSVAVDTAGSIYVAGTFEGPADLGGGTIEWGGNLDGFVLKLDPNGAHQWTRAIGGGGYDLAKGVATQGNSVVVVGSYQQLMTVNGATVESKGGDDGFVIQYSTNGDAGWVRVFGGTGADVATAVTIDGAGNVVVAGRFSGTTNFGGGAVTSNGFDDAFIAKYSGTSGAHLFNRPIGGTSFDQAYAVATDTSSIFVTGVFTGSVDFGGPGPINGNANNMFLGKYSLAGGHQWAKGFGASASVLANSLSVNGAGDVSVAGQFCGSFTLDGPTLSSVKSCAQNDKDVFAARLAGSDGSHLNSMRGGGTALDTAFGVTQAPEGRYFVVGGFQQFSEYGGKGLTSAGGWDLVVVGLAPL